MTEKEFNKYKRVVLLTKDKKYFNVMRYDIFLDFLDFLVSNNVSCHVETIFGLVEEWIISCGKRQLNKLYIDFNKEALKNEEDN